MNKIRILTLCFALCIGLRTGVSAQSNLTDFLPLLEAPSRTTAQNQQVLNLFASSKDPTTIFAAGASLVRIVPAPVQEGKLLNIVIKDDNVLKKIFAAVILTAMGGTHGELSSLLQDAAASQDHAVRAYAASAYTVLNPHDSSFSDEIVNLYIYDPAFAQRAMNLLTDNDRQMLKFLKNAAKSGDTQVRAAAAQWLGYLQNEQAAKQLLKMAKKETEQQAATSIASALSKNIQWTIKDVSKGLKTHYESPKAATYALALGFMTGNAIDVIKKGLTDENTNVRVNSARAAAYMAGVLSSRDAALYTDDKAFDITLLKGLIAPLSVMVKRDNAAVKAYADGALNQISKLM